MAFGLIMADIPDYVSCKFEMYIIKIALVISENLCIAFLYALSIYFIIEKRLFSKCPIQEHQPTYEPCYEKTLLLHTQKTKVQITAQLISAFVFAT